MKQALSSYLTRVAGFEFCWGVQDCCFFACDWVLDYTGRDPLQRWRGCYHNEFEATEYLEQGGGLLNLASLAFAESGLKQSNQPHLGDVGVVITPLGETLAIRTITAWACRGKRGLLVMPFNAIKVWRVS